MHCFSSLLAYRRQCLLLGAAPTTDDHPGQMAHHCCLACELCAFGLVADCPRLVTALLMWNSQHGVHSNMVSVLDVSSPAYMALQCLGHTNNQTRHWQNPAAAYTGQLSF